jgi:hypothetical protein
MSSRVSAILDKNGWAILYLNSYCCGDHHTIRIYLYGGLHMRRATGAPPWPPSSSGKVWCGSTCSSSCQPERSLGGSGGALCVCRAPLIVCFDRLFQKSFVAHSTLESAGCGALYFFFLRLIRLRLISPEAVVVALNTNESLVGDVVERR